VSLLRDLLLVLPQPMYIWSLAPVEAADVVGATYFMAAQCGAVVLIVSLALASQLVDLIQTHRRLHFAAT